MKVDTETYKEMLKAIMEDFNLTQVQVANGLGITPHTISEVKAGRTKASKSHLIALKGLRTLLNERK